MNVNPDLLAEFLQDRSVNPGWAWMLNPTEITPSLNTGPGAELMVEAWSLCKGDYLPAQRATITQVVVGGEQVWLKYQTELGTFEATIGSASKLSIRR